MVSLKVVVKNRGKQGHEENEQRSVGNELMWDFPVSLTEIFPRAWWRQKREQIY
jgi:hypothetical protein